MLSSVYLYLTETRFDQLEPILETIRRDVVGARSAAALGRDRIGTEPMRVYLPDAGRARAGPTP